MTSEKKAALLKLVQEKHTDTESVTIVFRDNDGAVQHWTPVGGLWHDIPDMSSVVCLFLTQTRDTPDITDVRTCWLDYCIIEGRDHVLTEEESHGVLRSVCDRLDRIQQRKAEEVRP